MDPSYKGRGAPPGPGKATALTSAGGPPPTPTSREPSALRRMANILEGRPDDAMSENDSMDKPPSPPASPPKAADSHERP